jgi:hypothetical protein
MMWPPMLMHLKIKNENTDFGIWLPLFLLFPIALAFLIILSPFLVIAIIVLWPGGKGKLVPLGLWAAFVSVCAMRGLKVDVYNQVKNETVFVSVV